MSDNQTLDSLFKLVHNLKRHLQEQIEALHLDIAPMHVRVLKIIRNKPQCTAVDIASFLDRDKAQVTRILTTLIKQEFIVKKPNPQDKRSQYLCLTPAGEKIITELTDIDGVMFEKMKQHITEQELEIFQQVARKMARNLN